MMRALRRSQAGHDASDATAPLAKAGAVVRSMSCARVLGTFAVVLSGLAWAIQIGTSTSAWAQVSGSTGTAFPQQKGGIFGPSPKPDAALPLHLQADELVYDTQGNKVIARGNVEIQYEANNLTADEVIYDQSANTLSASGNVVLRDQNGNIIRAERYALTDDFRDGFVQSLSVVARDNSRISAEQGTRRDGNVTEFSNAKFTPCSTDGSTPPLWCIASRRIIHDEGAATISYQDAQFELFGQPVFYLPYFEHPDPSVKRKSGFLAPGFGTSEDLGFFTEIPYYFALSPHYDFVFRPRYMSEQGVLWQGDWRHRLADGQYSIKFAAIDQDASDLPGNPTQLDGFRGSLETKGDFSLSSWWSYGWDITLESDDTFRRFYKLDSILLTDRVNNFHVTGMSERSYLATNFYHFGGLLFDDSNLAESRVHPIVDYRYVVENPILGGEVTIDANALSFTRNDGVKAGQTGPTLDQDMSRAVAQVKWRRRLTDSLGITYTPFAELRGDAYQINNYRDPLTGEVADDEYVARGIATGGVTVAYPWIANTASAAHIVEPIGQIIARQANVSQRRLPVEDARSLVFDDTNLFDTDKFSGYDRVETGTRANVGLQYTFQPWSGGYARVLAGQSFHLKGDNPYENRSIECDRDGNGVITPNEIIVAPGVDDNCNAIFSRFSGLETDSSDYVLGVYLAPTDSFRLISQTRLDDSTFNLRREDLSLVTNYGPFSARATYSYRFADPELDDKTDQQDVSARLGLRLTDRWSLLGGLRYDIDEGRRLTDSLEIRYHDDCFLLSVTYDEHFIVDKNRDIDPDRTLMFRVEFKHLGGFNYKSDVLDHIMGDQQPPGGG